MTIPAQIREMPGGPLRNATVHNASSRGLMISGADIPTRGRLVEVIRGRLALAGRVVWSAPDRCGIQVTNAYDPGALIRGCNLGGTAEPLPEPACDNGSSAPATRAPERSFDEMLAELNQVHSQLLAAVAELGALLAEGPPDRDRLAEVRLKLMRASRKRFETIDMVHQSIAAAVSARDRAQLEDLRAEGAALRVASSQHVADWGLEKSVASGSAYRMASGAIRASMRLRIMREKQVIVSMLETLCRRSAHQSPKRTAPCGR